MTGGEFHRSSLFPILSGLPGQADASRDASRRDVLARQERLLDAGLEETFPASDPVAVMRLT